MLSLGQVSHQKKMFRNEEQCTSIHKQSPQFEKGRGEAPYQARRPGGNDSGDGKLVFTSTRTNAINVSAFLWPFAARSSLFTYDTWYKKLSAGRISKRLSVSRTPTVQAFCALALAFVLMARTSFLLLGSMPVGETDSSK